MVTLAFFLFLAAFRCAVSAVLLSEYAHHAVLDADQKIKLFWSIAWDAETVSFAVEAETTGWVGLGFSSSGQMTGSDVVIGWVKDGKGYLTDRFADAKTLPAIDKQEDYELTGFQENGGKTLLKFKRKFDTCDPRDMKFEEGSTRILFAYHSEDPVSPKNMKYHEFRGSKTILLLNSMERRNVDELGWKKFNVVGKNVTIPSSDTTYWCSLVKVPELQSKHHITKVVPYVQKGNEAFVHHLLLYECHGNFNESYFDEGAPCNRRANMPYLRCRRAPLISAWAIGGEGIYYPQHAGYPIGGSYSPKAFMMEMHYDNPEGKVGVQDSSGLSIYYTDKLRQYDSGVLAVGVGVSSWHVIPPKENNWLSVGYCMHQCTEPLFKNTGLPGGGINIFASGLHTHLAGRASWTKHVRNGKELPEIARDNHYDFNFQDFQQLRKEINIQPGDDIIHYCKYDSTDKDQLIRGGESTREEMCLNFLLYYPRVPNVSYCDTQMFDPSVKLLKKYFGNVSITGFFRNPLVKMHIDWTEEMAADFRKFQDDVKSVIPGCVLYSANITTPEDVIGPKFKVPIPKITQPLPAAKVCQVTASGTVTHASCVLLVGLLGTLIGAL